MRTPVLQLVFSTFLLAGACGSEEDDGLSAWIDNTYLLEIPRQNWAEPRMIGSEIGDFVPQFLIGVEAGMGQGVDVLITTAVGGVQDMCTPTAVVPASAAFPGIAIGPIPFDVHIKHINEDIQVTSTIHDFTLTDILPESGGEGELLATTDARELYPLFTLLGNPSPEAVCNELGEYNASCQPCPDDGEAYCLTIKAARLEAAAFGAAIAPVTNPDPSCNQ